jgi:hypothetical protein
MPKNLLVAVSHNGVGLIDGGTKVNILLTVQYCYYSIYNKNGWLKILIGLFNILVEKIFLKKIYPAPI